MLVEIPESSMDLGENLDLMEVFSKENATRLPRHRPWDCVIDLVPNTKSHIYPLSLPEKQVMEEYTEGPHDRLYPTFYFPRCSRVLLC